MTYVIPQKTIPGTNIVNMIAGANVAKSDVLQALDESESLFRIAQPVTNTTLATTLAQSSDAKKSISYHHRNGREANHIQMEIRIPAQRARKIDEDSETIDTSTLSSVILGFGNVSPLGYSTRWR